MPVTDYDYIITGTGCAGLSLAIHMIRAGLSAARILLVDKAAKTTNDRTWCFWEKDVGPFELVVCHSWSRLTFYGEDFAAVKVIEPYRYKMIRGIDFYTYCLEIIGRQENITVLHGSVESMVSHPGETYVVVDGRKISCQYIFNSIPPDAPPPQPHYHYLLQHFKGWVIDTVQPCFDPDRAILMDFRVPRQTGDTFVYTMPLSPTRALVEYTVFSKNLLSPSEYEDGLKDYIRRVLKAGQYTIDEVESGVIPMTDHPFPSRQHHLFPIGTAGGRTKPSTGYTFTFIQRQSKAIVQALAAGKTPYIPSRSRRRRFYDSVLLDVLATGKLTGEAIFTRMFRKNSITDVLPFLDDESSLSQDLSIISSLPTTPFLKAAIGRVTGK